MPSWVPCCYTAIPPSSLPAAAPSSTHRTLDAMLLVCLQKQFLPREMSTAATELDYLAGPQGIGVQGVIMDCPAVAAAWLQSHDWCEAGCL
jgi:hypothetical protein